MLPTAGIVGAIDPGGRLIGAVGGVAAAAISLLVVGAMPGVPVMGKLPAEVLPPEGLEYPVAKVPPGGSPPGAITGGTGGGGT